MNLYVKRISNDEIVKTIPLHRTSERSIELVMFGLLRNMNTDDFYVDDSETDKLGDK